MPSARKWLKKYLSDFQTLEVRITKGVEISVRKVAPLGDPVEITVRGYELSLRKADAEMIEVE